MTAHGTVLRWIAAVGIASIAVARCAIVFAPGIVFESDPALLAGLGPSGSLVLDCLLLAAAGMGLLGEAIDRRPIDGTLIMLALLPAGAIVWHGAGDFGDLWRGSTWLAAAAAAATVAHLARDPALRTLLAALLLAVVVPLGVRGAAQVGFRVPGFPYIGSEHTATVREFDSDPRQHLRDQGLEPGSAGAAAFEERLRQGDPRGWFPTANLFATVMASGLIITAGLAWWSWRRHLGRRWVVAGAAGELFCALLLLASRSKGGLMAAAAGLALLAAGAWPRTSELLRKRGGAVALALVAAALLGVAVRGALLPEGFLSDRSLLYRWQYLVGAVRVMAQHPFGGVGPDGFQTAYTAVRLDRSPEEVTSAHSVFADSLAMLGLSGAAWMAMALLLLWRAGGRLAAPVRGGNDLPVAIPSRAPLIAAGAVAALGLLPAVAVEAAALGGFWGEVARIAGVLGYVLAAAIGGVWLRQAGAGALDTALAAAATSLLVHAQIEMTYFDPSACTWAWCALALAGRAAAAGKPRRIAGSSAGAALLASAIFLSIWRAAPAARAQALVIEAARALDPPAPERSEQAAQRERAASLLRRAHEELLPSDPWLLEEAARQRLMAAGFAIGAERATWLDAGTALAERAVRSSGRPEAISIAAEAWQIKAMVSGDAADWDRAIGYARRLTEIDPHGIAPWVRLGDLLWAAARHGEAAEAYERALESDRNRELAPLAQLPPRERERIQDRIEKARP